VSIINCVHFSRKNIVGGYIEGVAVKKLTEEEVWFRLGLWFVGDTKWQACEI
jgi:hypothetical protein